MGLEYIIVPEYGHPASEVLWDQRIDNCVVRVLYNGRELHPPIAMCDILLSLGPKIKVTPSAMVQEEIRTPTGNITIEKEIPSNSLLREINPFVQIIQRSVAEVGHLNDIGIYKSLILSSRALPDTPDAFAAIIDEEGGFIKYLENHGTLTFYTEGGQKYYTKGRPLKSESPYLVSFHPGFDQIAYQIMKFFKESNTATYEMIEELVNVQLGWLHDPRWIYAYLNSLERGELYGARVCIHDEKGNIKKIRENTWEYQYPLLPWGEAVVEKKEKTGEK